MLTLRLIKVIWNYQNNLCFCLQTSNTLQHPTVSMLVIQITNYYVMYVKYQLSDIGLYLLLSKFVVRIQTVEPRSPYMDHDQHFTMLIQTIYDV